MEFDLHIHSRYSFDCGLKPEKIVRIAKKRGLRGIAIVDHDTCEGGIEGQKYADPDFIVIPGIEIRTTEGDIIGLFITDPERPETDDAVKVINWIKE
ncbi:MAG: PHP domain-containing protein, partial [Planctomycetota bacterium]|nr:PHP domain-containing protein [Planctomycetota bacterium]